jgi:hypothetical protein
MTHRKNKQPLEEHYKSSPFITKINSVNLGDKSCLQATKWPVDACLIPLRSKTKPQKSKQKDSKTGKRD